MLKILIGIGLGFLLFSNQGARQTTADILRFGADALAPKVEDEDAKTRGVKFGRKRSYTPQQAAAVMEMRMRGDGYGTISSAMGMTASMVRRIIQQQEVRA